MGVVTNGLSVVGIRAVLVKGISIMCPVMVRAAIMAVLSIHSAARPAAAHSHGQQSPTVWPQWQGLVGAAVRSSASASIPGSTTPDSPITDYLSTNNNLVWGLQHK